MHPAATSVTADVGTGLNNHRCRNFNLQKGENKCYLVAMAFGATRDDLVDVDFLELLGGNRCLLSSWTCPPSITTTALQLLFGNGLNQ